MSQAPFTIGLLLFPDLTQLDLTGPWEIFSSMPESRTLLVWKTRDPVQAVKGMRILPDTTFAECPQLDLVCVPGGPGMNALLDDEETLEFLRRQAKGARYVTSVCTGSLVLGAAGLLEGKRAASHWTSADMLSAFGAIPTDARVVIDGTTITGGGVTAGIDFALRVVAELRGEGVARAMQLGVEYEPEPPFRSGTPATADPALVAAVRARAEPMLAQRRAAVARAAAKLAQAKASSTARE